MWSFPACSGSGMERVRLDVIHFSTLPDRVTTANAYVAPRECGVRITHCVAEPPASPTESSEAIPEDKEE